jgi:sugar lactone lactonase YvrE
MSNIKHEHICGRRLGLRFHKRTGDLYIADAYFGLLVVGPQGGLTTRLVSEVDGVPLKFTNDLDIDKEQGIVYFMDSSSVYQRRYVMILLAQVYTVIFSAC